MPELRSFVAVPLPGEVRGRIFSALQELAGELPVVKWSRKPENLHVTLKFLGPVAEDRLSALGVALGAELGGVPRFRIGVRGMGAFPTAGQARVIWAGIDDGALALAGLAAAVETVAARFSLAPEPRPFRGHVTVGRCKGGVDARAALAPWSGRAFGAARVDEVHLYESRLGRAGDSGSTYLVRSRAPLGAN